MNICICGGGNLGHVVGGFIAAKEEYKVSILTNRPEKWSNTLLIQLPDNTLLKGHIYKITDQANEVISDADIVFVCLPGPYIEVELHKIKPYLRPRASVGAIVSSTGFFFLAHKILPKQPLFGFQRVPFISRIEEYGHRACLLGFKSSLKVCIENSHDIEKLQKKLEEILTTRIELLDNFYEASLSNSNPLLHPSRLYTMWNGYTSGVIYQRNPYFYEEWTNEASLLYIDMDKEFQYLLEKMSVKRESIPSVLDYYESTDASSLTRKIRSIEAFKSIKSPMIQVKDGWVPDFQSRYFIEDIPYGLKFIWELAQQNKINTPSIAKVYKWGIKAINCFVSAF